MKQIQQESRNPNVLRPNGPSPLSYGQNKQNNQVEYTKIYGGAVTTQESVQILEVRSSMERKLNRQMLIKHIVK